MKKAEIPKNEQMRLQELISYQILDTPEEFSYDDITLLASSICKTPIALVSFIDPNRQWFKSHHGLDAKETPREISFCGHAIHSKNIFEIPDSFADARFADNPLATGAPNVRFYAGAPLINPQGLALGTLCVIDHSPRKLDAEQIRSLEALARQVVYLLELRKSAFEKDQHARELAKTSQKVLEQQQQLIYASKMSSLGIMASGVAHEINNPLAIIIGKLELILKSDELKNTTNLDLIAGLKKTRDTAWRIQKIVNGLKNFSRDSGGDPASDAKIQTILDDSLGVCEEKLKLSNIKFTAAIGEGLMASCRPSEVSQVLLNLLNNSIDAIAGTTDKWISLEAKNSAGSIEISITDSGYGIPEDIASKIMVPFFTTKKIGQGTGLGLSISKGLLESQGGELIYDSKSSNTRFVIKLLVASNHADTKTPV